LKVNVYARRARLVDGCCLEIEGVDSFNGECIVHIWKDSLVWKQLEKLFSKKSEEVEAR